MENKIAKDGFLRIVLGVLVIAVAVQSYFIFRIYMARNSESANFAEKSFAMAPLVQPMQAPNVSPQSLLRPAPLLNSGQSPGNMGAKQQNGASLLPPLPSNSGQSTTQQIFAQPGLGMGSATPGMMSWDDDSFLSDDPFAKMEEMREMMDDMMQNMMQGGNIQFGFPGHGASMPGSPGTMFQNSARISEDKDKYVVRMTIPGLDKSEITTEVDGDMLTISGVQKEETAGNVGAQMISRGYSQRQFQNSMSLPGPVRPDDLKVNYENDQLTITIPKA